MSEAELHVLHARLDGGIRNKAARGELRCGLPVGLVWGERDGEIRLHPDEAVTGAVGAVFERFAEFGSVRRVWLWFISEKLTFPLRLNHGDAIRWVPPSYHAIHQVLTNPAYAGAYTYGKSRQERLVGENGVVRQRVRRVPRSEWPVLITDHHPGYIDWPTYEDNLARIGSNTRPRPHAAGSGAVREGSALLQGIATCGHCGRRLYVHYQGRNASPGYHCSGQDIVQGSGVYCLYIGGVQIDRAVSEAVLDAAQPGGLEAALRAADCGQHPLHVVIGEGPGQSGVLPFADGRHGFRDAGRNHAVGGQEAKKRTGGRGRAAAGRLTKPACPGLHESRDRRHGEAGPVGRRRPRALGNKGCGVAPVHPPGPDDQAMRVHEVVVEALQPLLGLA